MHPPLTLHKHPMCAEVHLRELLAEGLCTPEISQNVVLGHPVIIEEFQKCHIDHPIGKFFGKCTDLKIKLDRCFREEKALKRKANFEESKKLKERLQAFRKETADKGPEEKNFV